MLYFQAFVWTCSASCFEDANVQKGRVHTASFTSSWWRTDTVRLNTWAEHHDWHKQWPGGSVCRTGCSRGYIVRERQRPTSQQLIHQSDKQRVKERMAAAASEPVEKPDQHIWWIHKASTWAAVLAGQHEGHRVGLLAKKLLSVPVFKDPQSKHTTTKKLLSLSVLFLYSCLCWKKMVSSCITTNWSEHKICFVFIFPARLLFFLL